jgi:predicted ATPase
MVIPHLLCYIKKKEYHMFVRFIGAPISGKTTVAAQVFAELKKSGQPNVEFVAEQARYYIAEQKWNHGHCDLKDGDQLEILFRQMQAEDMMHASIGDEGIVITDSSIFNSLWYMSDDFRLKAMENPNLRKHIDSYKERKNLLFFCSPLPVMTFADANRVHTPQEARAVHDKMMKLIRGPYNPLFSMINSVALPLGGPTDFRAREVLMRVYEKLTE